MWKTAIQTFPIIGRHLAWLMGNGQSVRVRADPWVGNTTNQKLSDGLPEKLHNKNSSMFANFYNRDREGLWSHGWMNVEHLGLEGEQAKE